MLPQISAEMLEIISSSMFDSMDKIMTEYHYPPNRQPELSITDMRLTIENYNINVFGNLTYREGNDLMRHVSRARGSFRRRDSGEIDEAGP